VVADEAEALALDREIAGNPAIADPHLSGVGCAAVAAVGCAGPCSLREDLGAVINDIGERRLDGIWGGVLFEGESHGQLLCVTFRN
jgi:hypothetical protein